MTRESTPTSQEGLPVTWESACRIHPLGFTVLLGENHQDHLLGKWGMSIFSRTEFSGGFAGAQPRAQGGPGRARPMAMAMAMAWPWHGHGR